MYTDDINDMLFVISELYGGII